MLVVFGIMFVRTQIHGKRQGHALLLAQFQSHGCRMHGGGFLDRSQLCLIGIETLAAFNDAGIY